MLLVLVAGLADAALELDAAALLNDMRGFVCCGMEIGRRYKGDVVAHRERLRVHCVRASGGGRVRVRLDSADVMASKQLLDLLRVRQGVRAARDTIGGSGMNGGRRARYGILHRPLHLFHERPSSRSRSGLAGRLALLHRLLKLFHERPFSRSESGLAGRLALTDGLPRLQTPTIITHAQVLPSAACLTAWRYVDRATVPRTMPLVLPGARSVVTAHLVRAPSKRVVGGPCRGGTAHPASSARPQRSFPRDHGMSSP